MSIFWQRMMVPFQISQPIIRLAWLAFWILALSMLVDFGGLGRRLFFQKTATWMSLVVGREIKHDSLNVHRFRSRSG